MLVRVVGRDYLRLDKREVKRYLLYDPETVRVVSVEDVRSHECEDRHDIE